MDMEVLYREMAVRTMDMRESHGQLAGITKNSPPNPAPLPDNS